MKTKLKKFLLVLFMILVAFIGYVEIVNRNSHNMTYRQKILKAIYPAWMWLSRSSGKNNKALTNQNKMPSVSFYTLSATQNNGNVIDFSSFKGKKVLIVNTASNCGYTNQYDALQKLHEERKDSLVVIAFPANDFKEQEKGTDEEIEGFCKMNYGVTFPIVKKSTVVKGSEQHPVFKWLTNATLNGWNDLDPSWNFTKFLINEEGVLTDYFEASVSPDSKKVLEALDK